MVTHDPRAAPIPWAWYKPAPATAKSDEVTPAVSAMNVVDMTTPMPKPPGKMYKVSAQPTCCRHLKMIKT